MNTNMNIRNIYETSGYGLRKILSFHYEYLLYFFIFVAVILIFLLLYIRTKFQFWAMQPVFHIYDLSYYFFPPGIILHDLPEKNKFCNFKNIDTVPVSKMSNLQLNKVTRFIRRHFLKNKGNTFVPQKENVIPYFTGHNCESYFSLYTEDELLIDTKTNDSLENKKLVSVISGRPLHIMINNGDKDAFFDVYCVDYLCVDKDYRKKGIAPQIIQTHEYNQRLKNKNIKVSLFKREGDLTGIVPLCVYSSYGYEMSAREWFQDYIPFHPSLGLIEIGPKNIQNLTDFIKLNHTKFDLVGICETANLIDLIKTKNIYCYIVVEKFTVLCAYFFRHSCTYLRKGVQVLPCFASINCVPDKDRDQIFVTGYKMAVQKIRAADPTFQFAVIEDISDNNMLLQDIRKTTEPDIVSPMAYFFYNFAYHSVVPNKVLLIN